ncbi:hypothetical protein [Streptomyces sp. MNP-20]|uniref:hypothetical protein n=1 Tax=Streptomyces sp. MNP-20 TaxID=2721165 RepID=UPI0015564410|nr:hypothetical protein [Streptomyces sp. MNP-20]
MGSDGGPGSAARAEGRHRGHAAVNTAAATAMLYLIAAEPTLLAAAPEDVSRPALAHRARDGGHPCLGCGRPATAAIIVNSSAAGPRWLDLCSDCWHVVQQANETLH